MLVFEVGGMTCGHCVRAVTEAVKGVDAAAEVAVDLGAGRVTVSNETTGAGKIAEAIASEGYAARPLPP